MNSVARSFAGNFLAKIFDFLERGAGHGGARLPSPPAVLGYPLRIRFAASRKGIYPLGGMKISSIVAVAPLARDALVSSTKERRDERSDLHHWGIELHRSDHAGVFAGDQRQHDGAAWCGSRGRGRHAGAVRQRRAACHARSAGSVSMNDSQLKRLTKAQLIAKINGLEQEIDALYYEQRPSRTMTGHLEERRFMLHGVAHVKTREVGTKTWTIRPVGAVQ
jgi:hypothetical protein